MKQIVNFPKLMNFHTKVLSLVATVLVLGCFARADIIVGPRPNKKTPAKEGVAPAKEKAPGAELRVLKGTLALKTVKSPDGTDEKKVFQLRTRDNKLIDLQPSESARVSHCEKFVGKTVQVRVATQKPATPESLPVNVIRSITLSKEVSSPKS